MKFVSHRDIVLRSAQSGQAIRFVAGEEQTLPSNMYQAALDKGILPVQDNGEPVVAAKTEVVKEPDAPQLPPQDGAVRAEKITEVIKLLVDGNDPRNFTAGGMPSAKAVSDVLRWRVDSKELRPVWDRFRRNGAEE